MTKDKDEILVEILGKAYNEQLKCDAYLGDFYKLDYQILKEKYTREPVHDEYKVCRHTLHTIVKSILELKDRIEKLEKPK